MLNCIMNTNNLFTKSRKYKNYVCSVICTILGPLWWRIQDQYKTRMHSSRMRTARSSSRLLGGLPHHMLGYTYPPGVGLETPQVLAWRPPQVWARRHPPGVGLETPLPDPSSSSLGVGLETCKACWDTPPWRTARHAGIPPARHAGIPPPCGQTDMCKNITFANLVCRR